MPTEVLSGGVDGALSGARQHKVTQTSNVGADGTSSLMVLHILDEDLIQKLPRCC